MERLTYDFCIGGNHCWQVKGADNLECREVCERQGDDGCKTCPIAKAFDRLAAIEDILGDEYDLDLLQKQIQAYREGRCSGNCETLNCGDCGILDKIVDRLAAYEDTGLEPCDYSAMAHALKQAERAREDLTEMIRQIGATGLDRLRELAEADREGRCMVLPKDGMVYYIEEAGGEKWIGNKPIQQVILRCGFGMALLEFSLFDKGKYFSRAEAEEALRREQE